MYLLAKLDEEKISIRNSLTRTAYLQK